MARKNETYKGYLLHMTRILLDDEPDLFFVIVFEGSSDIGETNTYKNRAGASAAGRRLVDNRIEQLRQTVKKAGQVFLDAACLEYVTDVEGQHTGGGIMVDYITLNDGSVVCISDDVIVLHKNMDRAMSTEEEGIGFIVRD